MNNVLHTIYLTRRMKYDSYKNSRFFFLPVCNIWRLIRHFTVEELTPQYLRAVSNACYGSAEPLT